MTKSGVTVYTIFRAVGDYRPWRLISTSLSAPLL